MQYFFHILFVVKYSKGQRKIKTIIKHSCTYSSALANFMYLSQILLNHRNTLCTLFIPRSQWQPYPQIDTYLFCHFHVIAPIYETLKIDSIVSRVFKLYRKNITQFWQQFVDTTTVRLNHVDTCSYKSSVLSAIEYFIVLLYHNSFILFTSVCLVFILLWGFLLVYYILFHFCYFKIQSYLFY